MYRYQKANEGIHAPDRLKQAVTSMGAKRPPRLPRAALIAACLCLALVGTAFAASVLSGRVQVVDSFFSRRPDDVESGPKSIADFTIEVDGVARIPQEAVSQEARDFCASSTRMPQTKEFDSWEEAEEFLGLKLPNNPVLDQTLPPLFADPNRKNCKVTFYGRCDAPELVEIHTAYVMGGGRYVTVDRKNYVISLTASIYLGEEETITSGSGHIFHEPAEEPAAETYVTPNGLQALILISQGTDGNLDIRTEFVLDGVHFRLFSGGYQRDADQMVADIKDVLDAYS